MKVDVFIDVLDLGTVLVKNPFDDGYITAVTIRPDLFNNLSLYEYELLRSKNESEGQLMDSLTEAEARKDFGILREALLILIKRKNEEMPVRLAKLIKGKLKVLKSVNIFLKTIILIPCLLMMLRSMMNHSWVNPMRGQTWLY